MNADGYLPNGATSATIEMRTGVEQYVVGMIAFATELYAPDVTATKKATDLNGGLLVPGDTLEYSIALTNTGLDDATEVVLTDPIPAGTTYVAGSLEVDGAAQSDLAGDDRAEFLTGGNQVRFRVGAGANATTGGTLAPGASATVSFAVTIDAGVADGAAITNNATVSFLARTLGTALETGASATVTATAPDSPVSPPPPTAGLPPCDPLVEPCGPPEEREPEPLLAPDATPDGGPASGRPRLPDLRGSVRATWNGDTLRIVLRVRISRRDLVRDAFRVRLTIPGSMARSVRLAPRRRAVKVVLELAGDALAGSPEGKRLVALVDPDRHILETRERNNTASTRVL